MHAIREMNNRMATNLANLVRGKEAGQILNDGTLMNMLTDYFDNLRLTNRQLPNIDLVYLTLPDEVKRFFENRFQNNPNNNLANLLTNENRINRPMINLFSTDEDEPDPIEQLARDTVRRIRLNQNMNQLFGQVNQIDLDQNPLIEEVKEERKEEEKKEEAKKEEEEEKEPEGMGEGWG